MGINVRDPKRNEALLVKVKYFFINIYGWILSIQHSSIKTYLHLFTFLKCTNIVKLPTLVQILNWNTLLLTILLMWKIYLWHTNWFHYFCIFSRNGVILLSQVTLVSTCLFFTSISILCHSIIKLEYTCYNQYLAKHHLVLHFPKSAYLKISIK